MANFRNITQVEETVAISEGDKLVVNSGGKAKLCDANKFLSDFIAEHETAVSELNNTIVELDDSKQDKLPEITSADAGKFLRVNSNGTWEVVTLQTAEEVAL